MAQLGFRTLDEMVGRVDMLETRTAIDHWKAKGLDFSSILYNPPVPVACRAPLRAAAGSRPRRGARLSS